jgi:hypothetical protein
MIALGFGAFVGRHGKESTSLGNLSRRDGVGALQDRASGSHLSAAGYGVAAIDLPCGENRRRGDRRNPFATHAANIDERRGTVRRITDVAHHIGGGERRSRVAPGVARLETT